MRDGAIERALRDDPGLTPSPGFTGRVMASVRLEAGERGALAFPWRHLAAGLSACAAVTAAGILLAPPPDLAALSRAVAAVALTQAAPWLAAAVVLTFLPTWWSMRLVGRRG